MGWFLFNNKKSKRKKPRRSKKTRSQAPFSTETTLRLLKRVTALSVILALAAGIFFGRGWLIDRIGHQRATLTQVVLHDVPAWMGQDRAANIRQIVSAQLNPNPLNHDSLVSVRQQLNQHPWIQQVDKLQRRFDGRVDVYAQFRQPVALIRAKDGYHLVDRHGVRLPGVYPYAQLNQLDLPALTGVRAAPPAQGSQWPGSDVRAGLDLAQLLAPHPFADQVRAIDVSNFNGRENRAKPHLILMTDTGSVRWGNRPGAEAIGEPDPKTKIRMLKRVAEAHRGRIDAGGKVIDVFIEGGFQWSMAQLR